LIDNGIDSVSVSINTRSFASNEFGIEDMRASVQTAAQIGGIRSAFIDGVREDIDVQTRKDVFLKANNLITITSGNNAVNLWGSKDNVTPLDTLGGFTGNITGHLTFPVLSATYQRIIASPAAIFNMGEDESGNAVLPLIADVSVKETLINGVAAVNANLNYAWMGDKENSILSQLPTKALTYKGWFIQSDLNMPRLQWVAPVTVGSVTTPGYWSLIPKFVQTAATKGNKSVVNPNWYTATVGLAYVPTPGAISELFKRPTNYDGLFEPQNYAGEVNILNIKDRVSNPLGKKAFFHSEVAMGPLAPFPETLYVFAFVIDSNAASY
jgi:hypothetical protein